MREYGALIVLPVMLFLGWMCTKRPTTVIRVMTSWLEIPASSTEEMNKSQELAKYVKDHPDTWPQKFPWVYQQVLISGFAAYFIFVVGLFIILASWVLS